MAAVVYRYMIVRGLATLERGDDVPVKKIGQFSNDVAAKRACLAHLAKAERIALAAGREPPVALFC